MRRLSKYRKRAFNSLLSPSVSFQLNYGHRVHDRVTRVFSCSPPRPAMRGAPSDLLLYRLLLVVLCSPIQNKLQLIIRRNEQAGKRRRRKGLPRIFHVSSVHVPITKLERLVRTRIKRYFLMLLAPINMFVFIRAPISVFCIDAMWLFWGDSRYTISSDITVV
jgi:hypothetical protein